MGGLPSRLPERPRTKPALDPFRTSGGLILLVHDVFGLGHSIQDDRDGTLWRLLGLMDGTRDVPQVIRDFRALNGSSSASDVRKAISRLYGLGVVEDAAAPPPPEFTSEEQARYSRNLDFFSGLTLGTDRSSYDLQRRLRSARVTVLGVGGVGGSTAASLAAAGVGHLRLVDADRVEVSNLNRQLLFGVRDIGRPKVEAAADRLRDLNPNVSVRVEERLVRHPEELPALLQDCDLFVLGADRPHEILLWTNDAAVKSATAWLENSYSGPRCAIALFRPGVTPCLRCMEHHLERRARSLGLHEGQYAFPHGASNPALAATVNVAGHLGALQALYFLTGVQSVAEGALLQYNLWDPSDVRVEKAPRWPDCPACGVSQGRDSHPSSMPGPRSARRQRRGPSAGGRR